MIDQNLWMTQDELIKVAVALQYVLWQPSNTGLLVAKRYRVVCPPRVSPNPKTRVL